MSDLQKELDAMKVKFSLSETRNKELETSLDAEKTLRQTSKAIDSKASKV